VPQTDSEIVELRNEHDAVRILLKNPNNLRGWVKLEEVYDKVEKIRGEAFALPVLLSKDIEDEKFLE